MKELFVWAVFDVFFVGVCKPSIFFLNTNVFTALFFYYTNSISYLIESVA